MTKIANSAVSIAQPVYFYDPTSNTASNTLKGGSNINTNQVAVTNAAPVLVVAARPGRQKVVLSPTSVVSYYVGGANVTASNGVYVASGGNITMDTSAAVYAIGANNFTLSFIEYY